MQSKEQWVGFPQLVSPPEYFQLRDMVQFSRQAWSSEHSTARKCIIVSDLLFVSSTRHRLPQHCFKPLASVQIINLYYYNCIKKCGDIFSVFSSVIANQLSQFCCCTEMYQKTCSKNIFWKMIFRWTLEYKDFWHKQKVRWVLLMNEFLSVPPLVQSSLLTY